MDDFEGSSSMAPSKASLFQVYLRLRPPPSPLVQLTPQSLYPNLPPPERFLTVEKPEPPQSDEDEAMPTHITIHPPSDSRKRAVEKFAFTRVFEERAEQIDIFKGTGVVPLVQGVLRESRDGLVATLGVTGSGKSHTMLGSKTQRGLTQLSLDLLYGSLDGKILHPMHSPSLVASLSAADTCEAQIHSAHVFLESIYGENVLMPASARHLGSHLEVHHSSTPVKRKLPQNPAALPRFPDVRDLVEPLDSTAEFAIVVSMYEVYNDRIFDLLAVSSSPKDLRRRALLFKSTEASPDRKVVAGLHKIVCGSYEEAILVLETGLMERRVAGTGSNSVSSRSHGFFCVEVKSRPRGGMATSWSGSTLTIVDLAGSERARNAKTAGATLAEAGKINESLMYLGQCLQMQSDCQDGGKPSLVPFRQCKLTELLFSNSFPSSHNNHHQNGYGHQNGQHHSHHQPRPQRNPQKAIMIVTADPVGDFNATSQILRYSALAREVTVPRIPSVSSTILAGVVPQSRAPSGRISPSSNAGVDAGVVEMAFSEIARLTEEIELLQLKLSDEETRRREAEENWRRAEDKAEDIECDVREECWAAAERKLTEERRRWMGAWEAEADRNDEHVDRKVEILTQGLDAASAASGAYAGGVRLHEDRESCLEDENEALRRQVQQLQRQIDCSESPTKRSSPRKSTRRVATPHAKAPAPLQPSLTLNLPHRDAVVRDSGDILAKYTAVDEDVENICVRESSGDVSPPELKVTKTPATGKKMRKLTARKRDLMDEDALEGYENF